MGKLAGKSRLIDKIKELYGSILIIILGGFSFSMAVIIELVSLIIGEVQLSPVAKTIMLELGITLIITGFIMLFSAKQNTKFITIGAIENVLENSIKDRYLKEKDIDDQDIKKYIIQEFKRFDKTIDGTPLKVYLDLMDISSKPMFGRQLAKYVSKKIVEMIPGIENNKSGLDYGFISPKSENVYLTSLIANRLDVPLMFVDAKHPDLCDTCDGSKCLSKNKVVKFTSAIKSKNQIFRILDCHWEELPAPKMKWVLVEDIILSGKKLCYTAAVIKNLEDVLNIKINEVFVIVRRREVDYSTIISKLKKNIDFNHDKFHAIWELNDAEIFSILPR